MYKWAVYLNNKCSKEQPEAWSVVGKLKKQTKKEKKNPNIYYHGADKLEEMPIKQPRWGFRTQKTFVSLFNWLISYQGYIKLCQFLSTPRLNKTNAQR